VETAAPESASPENSGVIENNPDSVSSDTMVGTAESPADGASRGIPRRHPAKSRSPERWCRDVSLARRGVYKWQAGCLNERFNMSKIRINELARQLEVKSPRSSTSCTSSASPKRLPTPVRSTTDKADQLRRYYRGESYAPLTAAHPKGAGTAVEEPPAPPRRARAPSPRLPRLPRRPNRPNRSLRRLRPSSLRRKKRPKKTTSRAPSRCVRRSWPVAPRSIRRRRAAVACRGSGTSGTAPARPIPPAGAPRPGQVLSGPRQPLPASATPQGLTQSLRLPHGLPALHARPRLRRLAPAYPCASTRPRIHRPRAPVQQTPGSQVSGAQVSRPLADSQRRVRSFRTSRSCREIAAAAFAMPGQAPTPRPGVPLRPQMRVRASRFIRTSASGQRAAGWPRISAPDSAWTASGGGPRPMHPTSREERPHRSRCAAAAAGSGRAASTIQSAEPRPRRPRSPEGAGRAQPARADAPRFAAPPPINRDITISEGITVKELSEKLDVKANL